jgi:hypothetical protein
MQAGTQVGGEQPPVLSCGGGPRGRRPAPAPLGSRHRLHRLDRWACPFSDFDFPPTSTTTTSFIPFPHSHSHPHPPLPVTCCGHAIIHESIYHLSPPPPSSLSQTLFISHSHSLSLSFSVFLSLHCSLSLSLSISSTKSLAPSLSSTSLLTSFPAHYANS